MASTPDSDTSTPSSCSGARRSRNSSQLAATMKAGATEPTTPMLSAVVKCRATNWSVPKAPPPVMANRIIRPGLLLSLGQSARRCGRANGSTTSATTIQRTTAMLGGRHVASRGTRDHVVAGPAEGRQRQQQEGRDLRTEERGHGRTLDARSECSNCTHGGQLQAPARPRAMRPGRISRELTGSVRASSCWARAWAARTVLNSFLQPLQPAA